MGLYYQGRPRVAGSTAWTPARLNAFPPIHRLDPDLPQTSLGDFRVGAHPLAGFGRRIAFAARRTIGLHFQPG